MTFKNFKMNSYFNKKQIFYRNKDSLVYNSRFFVSVSQPLELVEADILSQTVVDLNLRQINSLQFGRFFWLSQYVKGLSFGSSVLMIILEPFLDDEELKYSLYTGLLLSKSLSLNAISLTLRQSLGGSSVERTFFLNATNVILIKKI
jgi:ribosomal protein L19